MHLSFPPLSQLARHVGLMICYVIGLGLVNDGLVNSTLLN